MNELIESLNLVGDCKNGAYRLWNQFPEQIVFTSGRRDREQQAHAMATNVVVSSHWIANTYRDNEITRAMQQWVDDHLERDDIQSITKGLLSVLNQFSDDDFKRLNFFHHLSGLAFDVQPLVDRDHSIRTFIQSLPSLDLFLEREGALVRWHVQFRC